MISRTLVLSGGLILIVAAVLFTVLRSPVEPTATPVARPGVSSHEDRPSVPASSTGKPSSPPVASTLTISEEISNEIETAVVTYSPDALPTFEKLLASGEPDVREAARDGLVRLGEKGGASLLRRATARLTDPEEIKKFLETANYLELPSALEGPLKNGAPKE